jgi:primase-polymerase (primpol)-like protein
MLARGDARYCSSRCRVAAHRNQPPAELRAIDRWVRFSADKVPLRVAGGSASSTNPSTWSTYAEAQASPIGVGVGFVLNGDGIVCVDLDHCVSGNRLAPWAAAILADCPPTFTERSVSGSGLHVWGYANVQRGRKLSVNGGGLEVYGTSRYIAVTGRRWSTTPATLAVIGGWVASLLEIYG